MLAPRTKDDISIDRDGDLRGPGVSDNGAGLAALLAIAKAIKSVPPAPTEIWNRLLLVANVGEEGEGNLCGIRHLCRQPDLIERISAFLVLDGAATDHITTQALGSRRFEIAFSGPGGHSWSDFGIGNPVHALSRAMSLVRRSASARSALSSQGGRQRGSSKAAPASTRSRRAPAPRSISARKATKRSKTGQRAAQLPSTRAEEIENARAIGGKVTAKIREIGSRPAARLAGRCAASSRAVRAVDAHLGIRSRLDCASTDANIPLSMGIPAVSIGAGGQGGGAHTTGGMVPADGRDLGLKRVLLTAALLLRRTSCSANEERAAAPNLRSPASRSSGARPSSWSNPPWPMFRPSCFLALRFSVAALAAGADLPRSAAPASGILAGRAGRAACSSPAYVFQTHGLELTTPSKSAF